MGNFPDRQVRGDAPLTGRYDRGTTRRGRIPDGPVRPQHGLERLSRFGDSPSLRSRLSDLRGIRDIDTDVWGAGHDSGLCGAVNGTVADQSGEGPLVDTVLDAR